MICIGKVANTHGIKGELRILSNFKYKNEVFKVNNDIYINNEKLIIKTHRVHKKYDMLSFQGYHNINEVLKFKDQKVYIDEGDYCFSGILNECLIGFPVYNDGKIIGSVSRIEETAGYELLVVKQQNREYFIPYVDEFIKNIGNNKIEVNLIKGLIDED